MSKIAVIIPTLNEEITVGKVITDFRKQLPKSKIYVIDCYSTDRTKKIAENKKAKVIMSSRGKGNAVKTALDQISSDYYVIVDGDDTYPANMVKELLKPVLKKRCDMVVGSRFLGDREQGSVRKSHIFGNIIITKLLNTCFGTTFTDVLSGYRVLNKNIAKNLYLRSNNFEIETEMSIKASHYDYKIKEIPISYRNRPKGSKSKLNSFLDGRLILYTIISLFKDFKPFLFFGLASSLFIILGSFFGFVVLNEWLTTRQITRLPTAVLSSLLIEELTKKFYQD